MASRRKNLENISEEQLVKELNEQSLVAREILAENKNKKEKEAYSYSNPSAMALTAVDTDTGEGINRVRKTIKQLFTLYLTNQFVARAINVRADTLVHKGYVIVGEDQEGVDACNELIENSGGINLFWQLAVNTDIAGDGFLEKIYNQKKNKILKLKHVHPLTLSFKTELQTGKIIVGPDKEPVGYVQTYIDKDGVEQEIDVPKDRIEHLKFNTLGDEFTGMSVIQPGYNTIVRLMNMEYAAAEAAVKTANPLIIGKCNTKSPNQIAMWGQILGRITGREQIFLPQDMELQMLSPGQQNFNQYADYFLDAVVSCFGVPRGILLGGGNSNRAEDVVLTRHFYSMIRGNQSYIEDLFNKIFVEYAEIAGFKAPKLLFEDVAEDANLLAKTSIELFAAGIISLDEAREMIGLDTPSKGVDSIGQASEGDMIKKSNMETWHPSEPGKPAGSQEGVKIKQKRDPFSMVSPATK